MRKRVLGPVLLASAVALAVAPSTATAGELLSTTVAAGEAVPRDCLAGPASGGAGYAQRSVTAPATGWLRVRLDAAFGDWDLAVFEADTARRISGSTSFGADELAQTLVTEGERLTVQACRRSGAARLARLSVESEALRPLKTPVKPQLVAVSTPNRARKNQLLELGLDVTEHGGPNFLAVVLYGPEDAARLRAKNFVYRTMVRDLAAQDARARAATARFAAQVQTSALPSGRTTYRKLEDYTNEMKTLVEQNPTLVKPITLPFKTFEGRTVDGIEITTDVNARDGKPAFLNLGGHHAREWPASEHSIEWAHELVNGYKAGDERVRRLVEATRTIIVPVVNPDGFNVSREAGGDDGREGPDETANLAVPYEYHRKNCRVVNPQGDDPEEGSCTQQPATGLEQFGVDPNRNYGGYWGGPGASESGGTPPGDYAQDYRGNGPFSEPETKNIQDLVAKRQVVTLITNHTFSNLILRPPGIQSLGDSPDENLGYKALGDTMAAENGYTSQFGYELYDTTGTTEDWTYSATGGFGFTFEIGCDEKTEEEGVETGECADGHFHPAYEKVVAEYEGTSVEADENGRDGLGNREAYFIAMESTANQTRHSLITGSAPAGAVLRLTKSFKTRTSPVITGGVEGDPILFDDKLETLLEVPGSGSYEWHTNPSIRPQVARDTGRVPAGQPSPPAEFSGGITGTGEPGDDGMATPALPPDANNNDPEHNNDHVIEVPPQGNGVDNAKMTIRVSWLSPSTDWDIRLYRDADADGAPDDVGDPLSVSQSGPTDAEQVTISENPVTTLAAGQYVLRVTNFAAGPEGGYDGTVTFQGPDPLVKAIRESWTLTCESQSGTVLQERLVEIERGQRKEADLNACAAKFEEAFETGQGCDRPTGRIRGRRLDRARLGGSRDRILQAYRLGRRGRRHLDVFCLSDRGRVRVGYLSSRLRRRLNGRQIRRVGTDRAILILTNSKRFRLKGVRPGARESRLRRRLSRKGVRSVRVGRIGKNRWYVARASRARLVFKVRGRRVREIGIADKGLTKSRRRARRFLSSFR